MTRRAMHTTDGSGATAVVEGTLVVALAHALRERGWASHASC